MNLSIDKLKKLVNEKFSLVSLLKKHNPEEHYEVDQPCFCPFHDNTNTPAASIYKDEDGSETLYCFSERKLYRPSDAIEKLLSYDVYELGSYIWNKMSEEEQNLWLVEHNVLESYGDLFNSNNKKDGESNDLFDLLSYNYRINKITFSEFLEAIAREELL